MKWPAVRLDECSRIVGGATPSTTIAANWDGEVKWATPKDLSRLDSIFIGDTERKITKFGLDSCAAEVLPPGSVLFSSRAPIGHVAINSAPMATNQGFKSLIPNPDKVVAGYLYWWLKANRGYLESLGNGATFKEISKAVVARVEIPLPPLDEQRRIAAILDQADALRRKRCEALKILNRLGDAAFTDTFGDLIANSMEWQSVLVSDICDRITVGVVVKPASYYRETGIPAIRGTNIKASGIDLSDVVYFSKEDNENKLEKSRIWKDDLLIVRSGRPGMTALVTEELHGSNAIDVIIATPKQYLARPIFLRDFLNSPSGRHMVLSEARGQVQQHFNVKSLSSASIFLPPMAVQVAYETQVRKIDESRKVMTKQLNAISNLFASLQHRAFRGEL